MIYTNGQISNLLQFIYMIYAQNTLFAITQGIKKSRYQGAVFFVGLCVFRAIT